MAMVQQNAVRPDTECVTVAEVASFCANYHSVQVPAIRNFIGKRSECYADVIKALRSVTKCVPRESSVLVDDSWKVNVILSAEKFLGSSLKKFMLRALDGR
jgi:hypothetical protein